MSVITDATGIDPVNGQVTQPPASQRASPDQSIDHTGDSSIRYRMHPDETGPAFVRVTSLPYGSTSIERTVHHVVGQGLTAGTYRARWTITVTDGR